MRRKLTGIAISSCEEHQTGDDADWSCHCEQDGQDSFHESFLERSYSNAERKTFEELMKYYCGYKGGCME